MTSFLPPGPLLVAMLFAASPTSAEQRDFPTGEPDVNVTYLDAGGPSAPTACVVGIAAGLPTLSISFTLFSNNNFFMQAATEQSLPNIASGSDATLRVNSTYIFSKVKSVSAPGRFHLVTLSPVEKTSIDVAYQAINEVVNHGARIDVVADDAQMRGANIPPAPGLADALKACQQYLVMHLQSH